MKAGILTFHNAHNYGAALQVWATQTWLTRKGYDCEVINYRIERIDRSYQATSAKRKRNFEDFMKKNLSLSPLYKSLAQLQNADLPYDVIIAGSDQIWNADLLGGLNSAFFCNFGRPDARRIVYAASLGADELSPSNRFLLPRYLEYPDFISVREHSMLDLIRPLTQKPVTTALDPTFLLALSDYQGLLVPQKIESPYIYLHYIHHTGENPALDLAAKQLSEATGLPILKNRTGQRFANELPSCQDNGPGEFLGTLSEAAYVVTDSFHAMVFSILFSKHFLTVAPKKRPERLVELLKLLNLSSHLYTEDFEPDRFLKLPSYSEELPDKLSRLQEDSVRFLEHALTADIVKPKKSYLSTGNPYLCYGCGACTQTKSDCTDGSMIKDSEGFAYPTYKITAQEASPCMFSATGSASATPKDSTLFQRLRLEPVAFFACHKDLYTRMISFEGGVLPELIQKIHAQDGSVIGKVYDAATGQCEYRLFERGEDTTPLLAFRPQEADVLALYRLLDLVTPGERPILLLAEPCHIAALYATRPEAMKQVITLELSCNGVTSALPLRAYWDYLGHAKDDSLMDYDFSAKHYGKSGIRAQFTHKDGTLTSQYVSLCPLVTAYQSSALQRPSCYSCCFREGLTLADLTLSPTKYEKANCFASDLAPEDKIISVVRANTEAGLSFYRQCSEAFVQRSLTAEEQDKFFPRAVPTLTASRPLFYQRLFSGDASPAFRPFEKKNT